MTASPFGVVLEGNTDIDKAKFERHVSLTKPISATVVNNHQYALHLKRNVIPATDIFIRNVDPDGDGNDHEQYTPESYFEKYYPLTDNGALGLQFGNEGAFDPPVANTRLLPFMQMAVEKKVKISLPGVSVGNTPSSPDGWAVYHPFVEYACQRRDYVVLDVHEYFAALPSSGMVTVETRPGDSLYFAQHLRSKEQWQPKEYADFSNLYHVGRVGHLFTYARQKGLPVPVVDLGEFGADFVKDNPVIESWLRAIVATLLEPVKPGEQRPNVDGYRSLRDYWRLQFPKWTHQQTYFEMLKWLWECILKKIGVRSTRLFLWTAGGWPTFNYAGDAALQLWLETYLADPTPTPAPLPPPLLPVFPFDFEVRAKEGLVVAETEIKLRHRPTLDAPYLSIMKPNTKGLYIPLEELRPEEKIMSLIDGVVAPWQPVLYAGARGWAWSGVLGWKPIPAMPPDVSLIALREMRTRWAQMGEEIRRVALTLANTSDELARDVQLLDAIIASREKTNMEVKP